MTAVRDRPQPGVRDHAIDPVDLVILTIGLANAWDLSAPDLLTSQGQDAADTRRITRHRAAIIEATRRVTASP